MQERGDPEVSPLATFWRAALRPQFEIRHYLFFDADFFFGTLAPAFRASESPIAIACFLLVTFFPDRPLFSVPAFRSCIAFSTFLEAFLPYFATSIPPSGLGN